MAKFNVQIGYYGSTGVIVEADNEKEALEKGESIIPFYTDKELCSACEFSKYGETDVWRVDDNEEISPEHFIKEHVLICINEEKEVVSVSKHDSHVSAQQQMTKEYYDELVSLYDEYVESSNETPDSAHIYYGDNLEYHWEIWTLN